MFDFEKATPEEVGISSEAINRILKELDSSPVTLHSLLIMKDDRLIFERYCAPYGTNTLHRMFSISKSFTALAIALLAGEKKLSLDDAICDHFPEYVDKNTHPFIRMTTIRNMLQMRSPHASTTYKVCMKTDWVESFFKVAPTHKPGTVFHYDTSAAHVLCALVEKLSGMDMLDFLKEKAFKYLDFSEESYMIKDPFGVSMGGSGLMALPMDVMKVLFLLYKKGTVTCNDGQVRTLIDPEFIREATRNITDTYMTAPVASEAQGYGMQIWMNQKGGFTLYGMGGQLGICIPSQKLLIVTTADTQGLQGGNQMIYDAVYRNLLGGNVGSGIILRGSADGASGGACDEAAGWSGARSMLGDSANDEGGAYGGTAIAPPHLPESYKYFGIAPKGPDIPDVGLELKYKLDETPAGFEELIVHLSPNMNRADQCTKVSDVSCSSQCFLEFVQNNPELGIMRHRITFGMNGNMIQGIFPIYETRYVAGGIWTRDNVLYVKSHLIGESVGSVHFQLYFGNDDIVVFMKKIEETFFNEFEGHLYGKLI